MPQPHRCWRIAQIVIRHSHVSAAKLGRGINCRDAGFRHRLSYLMGRMSDESERDLDVVSLQRRNDCICTGHVGHSVFPLWQQPFSLALAEWSPDAPTEST